MSDPKGFLKFERKDPPKRDKSERILDFKEFSLPVAQEELQHQASRCMDCGVPFCQSSFGCPVDNLIPEWNELVQQGRWQEALQRLHKTNNFPEFTGKLCPAPCESACVLGVNSSPVIIRGIESSIIDRGFNEGWVHPQKPQHHSGKTVAIVGSGPAGLAAAQQLVRLGHTVTVLEKSDRIGGLLRYGIPDFKMEKWVLDRRIDQLTAEGVQFKTDVRVGADITPQTLLSEYDAICLAIGASRARDLKIPGRELKGIHLAMEYLTSPALTAEGKRVIILGGGDTGSDCLGTVLRQKCKSVLQFELLEKPGLTPAPQTPWPLWPLKLRTSHAHEEGGERQWSVLTTEFQGQEGNLTSLKTVNVSGTHTPVPGSEKTWETDLVLLALGFEGPGPLDWIEQLGVEQTPRSTIAVDRQFRTRVPKIFAAGDAQRGASLIVWAIAEGRKMATSVDLFLRTL